MVKVCSLSFPFEFAQRAVRAWKLDVECEDFFYKNEAFVTEWATSKTPALVFISEEF